MYEIDKALLEKIDALELSERNTAWRKAMKAAPWRVYVDRERLTVASWRETEGEDLEPLNDGSLSPMRGADKNGPTAVLRSAMHSGYSSVCCAAVLNQKFTSSLLRSEESIDKLAAYTNAYMRAGGSHIQYNILDSEQLKEAKAHPEGYQDLIVRIGGFSAYFVQLSKGIQDDVIYRSEFEL